MTPVIWVTQQRCGRSRPTALATEERPNLYNLHNYHIEGDRRRVNLPLCGRGLIKYVKMRTYSS